jgi:integrase
MTDTRFVVATFLTLLPITVLLLDAEISNVCQYFERIVNRGIMSILQPILRAVRNTAPRSLTNAQLSRILSCAKENPKLRDFFDVVTIISNTGPRARELSDLRWSDVDVEKRELVVKSKQSASIHRVHIGP